MLNAMLDLPQRLNLSSHCFFESLSAQSRDCNLIIHRNRALHVEPDQGCQLLDIFLNASKVDLNILLDLALATLHCFHCAIVSRHHHLQSHLLPEWNEFVAE